MLFNVMVAILASIIFVISLIGFYSEIMDASMQRQGGRKATDEEVSSTVRGLGLAFGLLVLSLVIAYLLKIGAI